MIWQFLAPIIHVINIQNPLLFVPAHGLLWLPIFLPIMAQGPYFLNSSDNRRKSFGRAFGFAFLIYYVVVLLVIITLSKIPMMCA